jgi:hypothetical protein
MKKVLSISLLVLMAAFLIFDDRKPDRPTAPLTEGCVFCHAKVNDPDLSHPVSAFGCYSCHLGNPYSIDKKRAHFAIVRNPGDLRIVERTCGRPGCHPDIVTRVKNSVMATNIGILDTIQFHWLNIKRAGTEVRGLIGENPPYNLAIDNYRKMCGGCHLWKERGDRPGEIGLRGGGCSDCHVLDEGKKGVVEGKRFDHPKMTIRIPSENCVKCHNRSARIGLSYFGRLESAGYGTPYEGRDLSARRLSGNRFFLHLEADIHFSKAGMECIDCHTAIGVMGDGRRYHEMKEQLDITCEACHIPRISVVSDGECLAKRLVSLNKKIPKIESDMIAYSKRGTPIYNLRKQGEKLIFFRKMDGHGIEMKKTSSNEPHHSLQGHNRLSCQACHSSWMPQCYGCHLSYRESGRQVDWFTRKERPGRWKEARSYLRFSKPALGFKDPGTIFPIAPCQVFISVFDKQDNYQKDLSFNIFSMSAFDPHTTSKKSRGCIECHGDPKSVGLGEGILNFREGQWCFRPTYDSAPSHDGVSFPLDGFVDLDGKAFLTTVREGVRPFNREEIERILSVNACLGCHREYKDKIYQDFHKAKRRFETESGLPCLR